MSITRTLLGRRGFALLLRPTVYAQFVAGESESEIAQSMRKMSSLGLRPMLAVPLEEDLGESSGYNSHHKKKQMHKQIRNAPENVCLRTGREF